MSGKRSHLAGLAAEAAVARRYRDRGCTLDRARWRGRGGEIDLVARQGATVIFVEVKMARTHDEAALRLGDRQRRRLLAAAEEFLGGEPAGTLTEARFDVALVDRLGRIAVIENALAA